MPVGDAPSGKDISRVLGLCAGTSPACAWTRDESGLGKNGRPEELQWQRPTGRTAWLLSDAPKLLRPVQRATRKGFGEIRYLCSLPMKAAASDVDRLPDRCFTQKSLTS